jgi:hypothetical protein
MNKSLQGRFREVIHNNYTLYMYYFIIILYYLNNLIGQEIVTWSSLKTRIDLKNHVLTWKNAYWLRENIRLFPPLTELVECCPIALYPKFQQISQNFKTNFKNFIKFSNFQNISKF